DRVDIVLVHDVGRTTHGSDHPRILKQVLDETLPELEHWRGEGLFSFIGLGVNEWEVCAEILRHTKLDCILLPGRYTLLEQPALTSGFLDLCVERGTRILAAGVFNSGILATRPASTSTYNYGAAPAEVRERASRLWAICERHGVPPQAAAVQFPLA